ncbi:hypothetical protein NYE70_23635 [Paenibacillus sp. FSL R5-0407]|uniref:phage adaptor protein n=1 Tax=Paenibacillus sp. FSL R5-0407 TaxID=2975320 RepID=UPI0030F893EC
MLVKDVVEEIAEKAPNHLSPQSILRKITQVRDRLLRQSGSAQQQTDTVCTAIDIKKGQDQYELPCPPGNVVDVDIVLDDCWRRLPLRQFHQRSIKPYYYFQAGLIGLVPVPDADITQGLKVFHIPVLPSLTVADMEGMTGFDPDYDMVLVYGVLRELSEGYDGLYQQILNDWKSANNGFEKYVVNERW